MRRHEVYNEMMLGSSATSLLPSIDGRDVPAFCRMLFF